MAEEAAPPAAAAKRKGKMLMSNRREAEKLSEKNASANDNSNKPVFRKPKPKREYEQIPETPPLIGTHLPTKSGRILKVVSNDPALAALSSVERASGKGGGGEKEAKQSLQVVDEDEDEDEVEEWVAENATKKEEISFWKQQYGDTRVWNHQQLFWTAQMANLQHNPQKEAPAIKIMHPYQSLKRLEAEYANARNDDRTGDIQKMQAGWFRPICRSKVDQNNAAYEKKTIEEIHGIYKLYDAERDREFKEKIDKRKTGELGKSLLFASQKAREKTKARENLVKKFYRTKGSNMEKMQEKHDEEEDEDKADTPKFVVIALFQDVRGVELPSDTKLAAQPEKTWHGREPLVAVFRGFTEEHDAWEYISPDGPLCTRFYDLQFYVVETNKWIFLETDLEDVKLHESSKNQKKKDLTDGMKEQQFVMDEFMAFHKKNGTAVNVIEMNEGSAELANKRKKKNQRKHAKTAGEEEDAAPPPPHSSPVATLNDRIMAKIAGSTIGEAEQTNN